MHAFCGFYDVIAQSNSNHNLVIPLKNPKKFLLTELNMSLTISKTTLKIIKIKELR